VKISGMVERRMRKAKRPARQRLSGSGRQHPPARLGPRQVAQRVGFGRQREAQRRLRLDEAQHGGRGLDEGLPQRVLLAAQPSGAAARI
jgi:hypothetical protein